MTRRDLSAPRMLLRAVRVGAGAALIGTASCGGSVGVATGFSVGDAGADVQGEGDAVAPCGGHACGTTVGDAGIVVGVGVADAGITMGLAPGGGGPDGGELPDAIAVGLGPIDAGAQPDALFMGSAPEIDAGTGG